MKTFITILLLCFTVNVYAGKPVEPPTEPEAGPVAFVGYTTGVLPVHPQSALVIGTDMCKTEFGETASIATSKEMRAAIDDGTYFKPPVLNTVGWFLYSDVIVTYYNTSPRLYDPHVQLQIVGTPTWYLYANNADTNPNGTARAPFSGTNVFPLISYTVENDILVACKS